MNGIEKLIWAQNAEGRVFLTSYESPLPHGYQRFSTTTPSEMDRVFRKLDAQTKEEQGHMTYMLYLRRRELIAKWRSDIRQRMTATDCSEKERAILRAALAACDKREQKLNRNSVYGVSAMQSNEAPLPPRNKRVILTPEEDRAEKALASAPPLTEVIQ